MNKLKKHSLYQKLFWPFTVRTNCSSDLKIFANSQPSASNFKSFSRWLEHRRINYSEKLKNQNFEEVNDYFLSIAALDNNNEMYKSHVELKRRIVELCIQAVLADMKDSNANTNDIYAMAEAQWTRNSKFHSEIEHLFHT